VGSLSLHIRYRPVRIGLCVESKNLEQLQSAFRLTCALAGGRFNPVIPVDAPRLAESLVDCFRVDLLFPVADTEAIKDFVKSHKYLRSPYFNDKLFYAGWQHVPAHAAFVDVYHAARRIREARVRRRKLLLLEWSDDDPLAMPLLAMAGGYPAASTEVPDYPEMMEQFLGVERVTLQRDAVVPPEIRTRPTPSRLTAVDLDADDYGPDDGIYVGDADDFEDLVTFWNIRAAGAAIVFYDARYGARLGRLLEAHKRWLGTVRGRPWQAAGTITVYCRDEKRDEPLPAELGKTMRHDVGLVHWNGLNIKPAVRHSKEQAALGSVDDSETRPSVTFALPEKPVYDHPYLSQQYIGVTISGSDPWELGGEATFFPPYIPELNEYYGRELHFGDSQVRAEPRSIWRSLSLLVKVSATDVTLRALPSLELSVKLFAQFGIEAKQSRAGQITSRLIAQMEDLQGCRVFKIEGVRTLIGKYAPDESFTRSNAVQTIGNADPATGKPQFEPFEDLFITKRDTPKLKPADVLDFLLERDVFRVGLELTCVHCELPFWLSVDDVTSSVECTYCGKTFKIARQLRDRDWAYRRSGLFGRNDNQQGGIPVAVTLQQLDTILSMDKKMLYTTSLELTSVAAAIDKCETDFAVIASGRSHFRAHQPQLVIGECKSAGGSITVDDAEHLAKVADAIPYRRMDVFILFGKTGVFTERDIDACRHAQGKWNERVILLSKDELEPYDIEDRLPEGEQLRLKTLEGLASLTVQRFAALRPERPMEAERRRVHRIVQERAYTLFEERGGKHGRDLEDWFTAEAELRKQWEQNG
jgi:hypothetical protein